MNHSFKRAFTLIELLVVIAIIAILAAILFPVFAQAKAAAKDSANLSNHKQTGLAFLQYSADYDDLFPLAVISGTNYQIPWQDAIQPYSKNRDILVNVKGPSAAKGANYIVQTWQFMGAVPRYNVNASATTTGYWQTTTTNFLVGGKVARFDGILGAGIDGQAFGGFDTPAPSVSQTSIQNISDVVMVAEGGLFDFGMGYFATGSSLSLVCGIVGNPNGSQDPYGATGSLMGSPHARKTPSGGWQGYGCNDIGSGRTTYVATDGSAKTADLRGKIWEVVQDSSGQNYVKRFYTGATN